MSPPPPPTYLFQSVCFVRDSLTPFNTANLLCGDHPEFVDGSQAYDTRVELAPGPDYRAGPIKRFFWGNHYRASWAQPVQVPVMNLDTICGGMEAISSGIGFETRSLRLQGGNGKAYLFRSINKDPTYQLNREWRSSLVGYIMKDQTSSSHPFGPLMTHPLMDALDILHPSPHLYLLPEDHQLEPFNSTFGQTMGFLEEIPRGRLESNHHFAQADDVLRSYRLFRYRYEYPQVRVDEEAYARARVFDLWVGDWDRREDNWYWGLYLEPENVVNARPIAVDRDRAFSKQDGLFPWLADREWLKPYIQHFGPNLRGIRSLSWYARHVDRLATASLTRADWQRIARSVQQQLSDSLVRDAVRAQPPKTFDLTGQELIHKLSQRRPQLDEAADNLYHLLAREVDVVGTNEADRFEVQRQADGSLDVKVLGTFEEGAPSVRYARTFLPTETREVRLFGLAERDTFHVNGHAAGSIRLRIVGGPGTELVEDNSRVHGWRKHTLVYEQDTASTLHLGKEGNMVPHAAQAAYNYDRKAYDYHRYIPFPSLRFNSDDGFMPILGVRFKRQGYGKPDFQSLHTLRFMYATSRSYELRYEGLFRAVINNWDLLLEGSFSDPDSYLRFFGIGNETVKDDSLFDADFYRTRYQSVTATMGLSQSFWKRSNLRFDLRYENNEGQIPENSILFRETSLLGVDRVNLLLFRAALDLDFRNNRYFPERGMRLFLGHTNGFVMSHAYSNYGQTHAFLEGYLPLDRLPLPGSVAAKVGLGDSYGAIPFYKQFNLGHKSNLRGYRRNRFTGNGFAYLNTELRIELSRNQTSIIPYRFGLKGFLDTGRIFQPGEAYTNWHTGFGWGGYFIPFSERASFPLSMGFSQEEQMLLRVSIGRIFR